jgi:hypothetical protein
MRRIDLVNFIAIPPGGVERSAARRLSAVSWAGQHIDPAERLEVGAVALCCFRQHLFNDLSKTTAELRTEVLPEWNEAPLVDPADHRRRIRTCPTGDRPGVK